MYTIHLDKLLFRAFHGIYEEERILGNDFEVTLTISVDVPPHFKGIESTVNYEMIFQVVKDAMQIPTPLLESVAEKIIEKIGHQDNRIYEISISIFKLRPPINGFNGKVGITLSKKIR